MSLHLHHARIAALSCLLASAVMASGCSFFDFNSLSTGSGGGLGGGGEGGGGGGGSAAGGAGGAAGGSAGGGAGGACASPPCVLRAMRIDDWPSRVYAAPGGVVWVGGAGGYLARWSSSGSLSPVPLSTYSVLGLSGSNQGDVWVGTTGAEIFRFDGSNWSPMGYDGGQVGDLAGQLGTPFVVAESWLYGFDGAGFEVLLETGSVDRYFLRVDAQPSQGLAMLHSQVFAPYAPQVTFLRLDGGSAAEALPTGAELNEVRLAPGAAAFVVGKMGTVLRGVDGGWESLAIPAQLAFERTQELWGVWPRSDDEAWVVGDHGTVLRWRADAGFESHSALVDGGAEVLWLDVDGQDDRLWLVGRTGVAGSRYDYDGGLLVGLLLPP